ncbi:uncharacterized protein LOC118186398 [Stegodyphus dumicola]|uniref:uncharacterized protein LOC118186398 n=1 Tax=Stegodyphus dumicola TaxID=202533 RepID=UPI0015AC663A|nr:uncharacterized protein LOC118186398 [Stegodyphus dumicola]
MKQGKPPDDTAYRLNKIAEYVIHKHVLDFIANNNILIPEQHGFRPRYSTVHQHLRVVENISKVLQNHKSTGGLSIPQWILIVFGWKESPPDLSLWASQANITHTIKSYLPDRYFVV